jgi:predicted nucleic acid-binding protein
MVASVILHVECLRSIDRARLARAAPAEAIAIFRAALSDLIEKIDLVDISSNVLLRASQSLPFPIRTLDAIHLATAIEWRERNDPTLTFATHDHQLALAARALRFAVIGA